LNNQVTLIATFSLIFLDDVTTLFRNNTLPCKGVTAYLGLFGTPYVKIILGDLINQVCSSSLDLEVDPSRLKQRSVDNVESTASANMGKLLQLAQSLLFTMTSSVDKNLPFEVREILHFLQVRVIRKFYKEGGEKTQWELIRTSVSAFLFLRLLCPALITPQILGIVSSTPSKQASRTLMLLSKILLNLSCGAFLPEDYMKPANEFIERNMELMRQYIEKVSSQPMRRQRSKLDLDEVNILWSYYLIHKFMYKNLGTIKDDFKARKEGIFTLRFPDDKRKDVIDCMEEAYDIIDLLLGPPISFSKKIAAK
jgi:hypothetical protein